MSLWPDVATLWHAMRRVRSRHQGASMKTLSWLATGIVLTGFFANAANAVPPVPARWTIMVYMSGDNNLEDYIVDECVGFDRLI